MPVFIKTHPGGERDNYRLQGEKVKLRWRIAKALGLMIRGKEDPSGNELWISGKWIIHMVVISDAELYAAMRAKAESREKTPDQERRIITPTAMIPGSRKRTN